MKISEVIGVLQKALKEHGDIDVRLQADHAGCCMSVTGYGKTYAGVDEWMLEDVYESKEECKEDLGEDPKYMFFELQAF